MDAQDRMQPPRQADEIATVRGFLDHHRDTMRWKTGGLDSEQLATRLEPSALTLGGLLKHMALVEDVWFNYILAGRERVEPWRSVDWKATPDWELDSAADDDPEELRRLFDTAVAESDRILDEVLAGGGLEQVAARTSREGASISLRWILVHMIEEYARHNGHADLIRESIDGSVGM